MTRSSIRTVAVVTIVWWLGMILRQVIFVARAAQPEFAQDPQIGEFARRYAVESSIQLGAQALLGCALSMLALWTRARWACLLVLLFTLHAFWSFYIWGAEGLIRGPISPASLRGAMTTYLRLHCTWSGFMQALFLICSAAFWSIATIRPPRLSVGVT